MGQQQKEENKRLKEISLNAGAGEIKENRVDENPSKEGLAGKDVANLRRGKMSGPGKRVKNPF